MLIKGYESGISNIKQFYCQQAKAVLDLGPDGADSLVEEWSNDFVEGPTVRELQELGVPADEAMRQVSEGMQSKPTLPEYLAQQGYTC